MGLAEKKRNNIECTMINIYKYKWQFMLRNKEFGDMWEELRLYVVYSVTPMGNRDLKVLVI